MPACNSSPCWPYSVLLISIFGIYSVSSSNIAQRRKEVAVRKVMGASSKTIISMFFKEYLTIVVIANAVALPLAWLFMHGWLEQYPYRINIGFWMYAIILLATSALIICTVLYQTLKASETNPAEVIKVNKNESYDTSLFKSFSQGICQI